MRPQLTLVTTVWLILSPGLSAAAEPARPILVGLSAEFGLKGSQAAQSIEKGIRLAMHEINAAGGLLGGRRLELETRDDRGVPARGIDNLHELAKKPELVAVFCGRFSPVAIEMAPIAHREGVLLLDPWAAADPITAHPEPNFVFRLSLTDSWAIATMLDHSRIRKLKRLALFVPNTAWGRSSQAALDRMIASGGDTSYDTTWYNWGDTTFSEQLAAAHKKGAQALLMVANEAEGSLIVRQMAALPPSQRLPIIAHWGILGGDFRAAAGEALDQVDLVVVHTFSFGSGGAAAARVSRSFQSVFQSDPATLHGQVGFAHAYDLMHLLAIAIRQAGTADRDAVRRALERIDGYAGLVRKYARPFGPGDHEALDSKQVSLGRFDQHGFLRPASR
jgi:branched-chain amino acid transport system substrate-binding protein